MKLLALSFVAFAVSTGAAAAPVASVLGVPVGGKLTSQPKICPSSAAGNVNVGAICWVGQPQKYGKWKSGMVVIPGADKRPKWAAHANFNLRIASDGTIENLMAQTHSAADAPAILESISSRFGPQSRTTSRPVGAAWIRPEVYIEIRCSTESCMVDFMSAASYAQWQQDLTNRRKIDAGRPISP